MKIEELRKGSIIQYDGKKCIVTGIYKDFVYFKHTDVEEKEYISNFYSGSFSGIKLNEILLFSFDFSFNNIENVFKKNGFILDREFVIMDIDIHVKLEYVHELQNIYLSLIKKEVTEL